LGTIALKQWVRSAEKDLLLLEQQHAEARSGFKAATQGWKMQRIQAFPSQMVAFSCSLSSS
jgi:hypothetical protein